MGKLTSPCRNICRITDNAICIGCGRSLQEIASWKNLNDVEKQQIIAESLVRIQQVSNLTVDKLADVL